MLMCNHSSDMYLVVYDLIRMEIGINCIRILFLFIVKMNAISHFTLQSLNVDNKKRHVFDLVEVCICMCCRVYNRHMLKTCWCTIFSLITDSNKFAIENIVALPISSTPIRFSSWNS
jgi:hypothetical protein